jgi:predicted Zn-dependent protease
MKNILLILITAFLFSACSKVAITGRRQLNIIPDQQIMAMSFQQYDDFLSKAKLSKDKAKVDLVKKVGKKIQASVEAFFKEKGLSSELRNYDWEFNVVESKEVNAWCMPGGKVVVYTGILPVTQDETGLAVVMGHEIAHAVAEHGNERMSQGLIAQYGGMALGKLIENEPEASQQLYMSAFGLGAQYGVLLPFSRKHESEADHMGLIFMAMAGYNPEAAVSFWQRMAEMSGGQAPPEFLSTHPSNETRINDIKKHLPEAKKYYKK